MRLDEAARHPTNSHLSLRLGFLSEVIIRCQTCGHFPENLRIAGRSVWNLASSNDSIPALGLLQLIGVPLDPDPYLAPRESMCPTALRWWCYACRFAADSR